MFASPSTPPAPAPATNSGAPKAHRRVLRPADVGELHQPRMGRPLLALEVARPVTLGHHRGDHLRHALARERHALCQHLVDQHPEAGRAVLLLLIWAGAQEEEGGRGGRGRTRGQPGGMSEPNEQLDLFFLLLLFAPGRYSSGCGSSQEREYRRWYVLICSYLFLFVLI